MKLLLLALLVGFCFWTDCAKEGGDPVKKIRTAYDNLSPRARHYYDVRLGPSRTLTKNNKELVKWYATIHYMNFPEIYQLLETTFDELIANYEGSAEGREFMKKYFNQISKMPDNSSQSFDTFHKALQSEWNKLESNVKEEVASKLGNSIFGETVSKQAPNEQLKQKLLSKDRLDTYIAYYNGTTARQEDRIRVAARMHSKDVDLFEFAKASFDTEVERFDGSEKIRNFLKHFYNRVDKMKDDSDGEFNRFVKDVNAEWNELSVETKLLFISHFGFYDDIIGGK